MNKKLLYLALSLIGITSCTSDFEDINTNPGGLKPEQVTIQDRFYQPILSVYYHFRNGTAEFQRMQSLNADMYSGYMATPTPFNGNNSNATYAMVDDWNDCILKFEMLNVMKPTCMVLESTQAKDYRALAKIIRVAGMHRVADCFGPIPFSQAMQGGMSVPYDDLETLYTTFVNDLEEAVDDLTDYIDAGKADPARYNSFDVVCGGDLKQWVRFANTLRLRLAIRMAVVKPELAKSVAESAVHHSLGVLNAGNRNVEVVDDKVLNPINTIVLEYGDMCANASLVSLLKGYNDPRLSIYLKPVGWYKNKDIIDADGKPTGNLGEFVGVRDGAIVNKDVYRIFSIPNLSTTIRDASYTGDNVMLSNHLPWMKVAESYFLRAEGALRGWNMGGSAQSFYEEGIKVAFDEYQISPDLYSAYIENDKGVAEDYVDPHNSDNNIKSLDNCTIKWDESASKEEKLHKIINQKWLAMFPEGQEAWSEFRRTGYPKIGRAHV